MKVLFDHQTYTLQTYGGISRFFFELFKRFNNTEFTAETSLLLSNNSYLNSKNLKGTYSYLPNSFFRGKVRSQLAINQYYSELKLKSGNYDIFHPTYYDPYFLKYLKNKPYVVTFHDMIHEKFAKRFPEMQQDTKIYNNKKLLLDSASKVIAISESTKKDIIEIFGVDPNMIEVIYLGNSLVYKDSYIQMPKISEQYLLFVGNRSMYKNFSFYLESVSDILITNNLKFICAGGGKFTIEEINFIKTLKLEHLVDFQPIDNDEILANLYANAFAFVFPSLYEGFGIPVLEAFACNCPCLLSAGGSLQEVGGDAAIYYNADSNEEIRSALNSLLLFDNKMRQNLIEKGKKRLDNFSWDKTFQNTVNLYSSLI